MTNYFFCLFPFFARSALLQDVEGIDNPVPNGLAEISATLCHLASLFIIVALINPALVAIFVVAGYFVRKCYVSFGLTKTLIPHFF